MEALQQKELVRILNLLRANKKLLQEQFSVKRMWLFGSFARGDFSNHSDVDILVEFDKRVGLKFLQLEAFLEGLLKRKVDLVTPRAIKNPYVAKDIKEYLVNVF